MKNLAKLLIAATFSLIACSGAFAWSCPKGQHWVQKPGQTNVEVGSCVSDTPDPSGAIATAKSDSNSSAISKSDSSSNASSSASQKQNQNQTQSATASNGDQSNAQQTTVSNNTNYNQVRQVASAIAPDAFPTAPCTKSFGGGIQTGIFGASGGGGKIDRGCDDRETARSFALMGNRVAAAKILCQTPAAKRAKLTLEECSTFVQPPAPVQIVNTPAAPQITVNVPAPIVDILPLEFTAPAPLPILQPKPPVRRKKPTVCPVVVNK